jgi:hypothetical protein
MPADKDVSLGKLYLGIREDKKIETDDFKPERAIDPKYVTICKSLYAKAPSLGTPNTYKEEMDSAIRFLDWKLAAKEYNAAIKLVAILGVFSVFILTILIYIIFYVLNSLVPSIAKLEISSGIVI